MESRPKRNLNNPTLRGRLRSPRRAGLMDRPHEFQFNRNMTDVHGVPLGKTTLAPSKSTAKTDRPTISSSPPIQPTEPRLSVRVNDILVPRAHGHHILLSKPETSAKAPIVAKQVVRRLVDISPSTGAEKMEKVEDLPKAQHIEKTQVRVPTPRPDLPKQKRSSVLRRQITKPAPHTPIIKHRRHLMPTVLSGLAVVLFAAGILVLVNTLRTNHTVKAQVKQLAQKTQTDDGISEGTPSEANPPSSAGNNDYQVSADLPRIVTIDKINVSARVRRVGIGPNNVLNAPANIFDVGWYDGSAKPGENGTIVLDGHVSGPTKHGVFYSIGTLKPGDKITLERGDGKKFTYSVTGTELFDNDKVDMSKVVTSSVPGKPGLNLMTCAGRFNVRTNQFEQRVVVYTVQDK